MSKFMILTRKKNSWEPDSDGFGIKDGFGRSISMTTDGQVKPNCIVIHYLVYARLAVCFSMSMIQNGKLSERQSASMEI